MVQTGLVMDTCSMRPVVVRLSDMAEALAPPILVCSHRLYVRGVV